MDIYHTKSELRDLSYSYPENFETGFKIIIEQNKHIIEQLERIEKKLK